MIITKTPLRVSFVGGGSDIPQFYKRFNYGSVVSAAINSYVYVIVSKKNDFYERYRLNYSKTESVERIDLIKNEIIRECIKYTKIKDRLYIATIADVPSNTGLGSSSSFCVGLLNALYYYKKQKVTKRNLAEIASKIEIKILKNPIGKQDHYAAAFGGFNHIQFYSNNKVKVKPLSSKRGNDLLQNSLLVWTTKFRSASKILKKQKKNLKINSLKMIEIRNLSDVFSKEFKKKRLNLLQVGKLIERNWALKKGLTNLTTNKAINDIHKFGLKNDVLGSKLLGAGGGGFILFIVDKKKQKQIIKKFKKKGYRVYNFSLDTSGSSIKEIL